MGLFHSRQMGKWSEMSEGKDQSLWTWREGIKVATIRKRSSLLLTPVVPLLPFLYVGPACGGAITISPKRVKKMVKVHEERIDSSSIPQVSEDFSVRIRSLQKTKTP